jgi:malate synthase
MARVQADKQREARAGHDGTWVAHPGLEPVARAEFDAVLTGANQLDRKLEDVQVDQQDLLAPIHGEITEAGLRANIRVALLYLSAWLGGNGCVPIDHLMEDAATAEISRTQLWQWVRHPQARLEDGRDIDLSLYQQFLDEVLGALLKNESQANRALLEDAAGLLDRLTRNDQLADFLTLDAYEMLGQ